MSNIKGKWLYLPVAVRGAAMPRVRLDGGDWKSAMVEGDQIVTRIDHLADGRHTWEVTVDEKPAGTGNFVIRNRK